MRARSAIRRGSCWREAAGGLWPSIRCGTAPEPVGVGPRERNSFQETTMEANNGNVWRVKVGLGEMLKGGVIMDVTTAEQSLIAEQAGACAVMALERVPAAIRKEGGVARMASPKIIREIMAAVTIPVVAKEHRGHVAGAQA